MDLRDYWRVLRKQWLLIIGCTLLGLIAAAAVTFTATKQYQAEVRLFVSTPNGDTISNLAQGGQFTQQRVKSYADIVNTPAVTQPVIMQLGLALTSEQLANMITASAPLDTVLIDVDVTNSDPRLARDIANSVGNQFVQVVNNLETPEGAAASPVKLTVVRPAQIPTAPVSPRRALNLGLGFLVGLAVGVGAAVLRDSLDTTVKRTEDLVHHGGAPAIGVIGFDPQAPKRPLVVQVEPHSPRAESFRQLRTNLQFLDIDDPPRSIVVTSSLPGEGKTTTTANLAITLAQAGVKVILLEADLRRPKIAGYLGIEGAAGLTSVLIGRASVHDVLQEWGSDGLRVLTSGQIPPNPSELLSSHEMSTLLKLLEADCDLVLIDAPPLLPVTDAAVLSTIASGALLVVRHGKTKREQLSQASAALRNVDARVYGAVLNMAPTKGPDAYAYGYGYSYAAAAPAPFAAAPAEPAPAEPTPTSPAARKPPLLDKPEVAAAAGSAAVPDPVAVPDPEEAPVLKVMDTDTMERARARHAARVRSDRDRRKTERRSAAPESAAQPRAGREGRHAAAAGGSIESGRSAAVGDEPEPAGVPTGLESASAKPEPIGPDPAPPAGPEPETPGEQATVAAASDLGGTPTAEGTDAWSSRDSENRLGGLLAVRESELESQKREPALLGWFSRRRGDD